MSTFYRMYRCADDGWLFVAAIRSEQRNRLLAALGEDELVGADDEKAAALLEDRFLRRPAREWFDALDQLDVPVEVVDETFCRNLFDDPDARATGLVSETWAGNVGRFEDPGFLVNFSETPCVVKRGPSMCGEHTREVLVEHGYTAEEVDALVADRAALDAPVETP